MESLLGTITNKKLLLLFITLFIFYSCCSIKNYDYEHIEWQQLPREAVNIAIADYSKQLSKRKDIRNVVAVDIFIGNTTTEWFYISFRPWQLNIDDASGTTYLTDKLQITMLNEYIGKIPPSWIPTDYMEKAGVLYVWHDPQIVLAEKIINVLAKYNLLNYSENEEMILTTDGGDMSYIFCKTNFKRKYYRKVKASFITPLPSCGCH